MSNPPRVVLLDSNAYFRLARSIRPLLAKTFGPPPPYSLFVLAELDDEYFNSSRLQHKFEWVNAPEYKTDRQTNQYSCKGKWVKPADNAYSFLKAYANQEGLNLAPEDLKALAVGFVRKIPVVSDDGGMCQVASAHSIECWRTLDLMKRMVACGRINVAKVDEILQYLDHENDLGMPKADIRVFYQRLFGANCPL